MQFLILEADILICIGCNDAQRAGVLSAALCLWIKALQCCWGEPSVEVHVKYCCSHCKVRPTAESISAEWIHKRVDLLCSTIRQEIGL